MAEFKDRLSEAIKKSNLKQADIVERTGINKGALSSYLSGKYKPKQDNTYRLAKILNVNEGWLLGLDVPMQRGISNNILIKETITPQYPFIPDAVAAGIPCTIEGRKELPTIGISDTVMGKYAGNKHILIMRVNGESMNKVIPSGSFIAVKTDIEVKNLKDGDLVVFGKEHEYSLKRFYDAGDRIIFKPDSTDPRFADHLYSKDDTVFIIGKVVLSIRNYE
ncbi:LexA family protein [Phascolarctobacterium sp.]